MIVMKFGGTSVESAEAIQRVASIVRERLDRRPVVVVSAMGKTTNKLLAMADTAASGEAASGEEEVTLQLWHHWSTSRHPLLQARVEAFMELYPHINVVETLQPQDGIVEKLLTAIAGGSAPDVAMLHRRNLQAFAAEGALVPIDSYIAEAGIEEGYWYPGEYSSNIFDGQIYGLPLTEARNLLVETFERAAIERALSAQDGNISAAARQLGIHRQSLQQKMKQLGIGSDRQDGTAQIVERGAVEGIENRGTVDREGRDGALALEQKVLKRHDGVPRRSEPVGSIPHSPHTPTAAIAPPASATTS